MSKKKPSLAPVLSAVVVILVGASMAWLGGQHGITWQGIALFPLLVTLAFTLQWVAFVPAYILQSEHFYDLVGALTYITLAGLAVWVKGDARSVLLAACVIIWAVRLGSFLYLRIRQRGEDRRFAEIRTSPPRFFLVWTMQGLWVVVTSGAAVAAMTSRVSVPLDAWAMMGVLLWLCGFIIEAVADRQKQRFRDDPANQDQFIATGLWAWSRHPNYFGEIMLWTGVALIAWPALAGWQHATLISPLFVYLLLTKISGIPLLEREGKRRWGSEGRYQHYLATTPALFPRPPRRR